MPDIITEKKVFIATISNSLSVLIKFLYNILEKEIINFKILNGIPLIYELDNNLNQLNDINDIIKIYIYSFVYFIN